LGITCKTFKLEDICYDYILIELTIKLL